MNITIKNVPAAVLRVFTREASKNRRSLNDEIVLALETAAVEVERRRGLSGLRKELDRFAATLPRLDESTPMIRRDRER